MSITYTFVTSLIVPTSTLWPCADFGEAAMPNILLFSEASASRGAPWFTSDIYHDLVIMSDDGVSSWFSFSIPFEEKYTFETTFKPSSIPGDLLQLDNYRFFIGTYDKQANCGGVLLSRTGIALVASFGSTALVLPGSQHILSEGEDYYTLRIVIDGEADVMYLYITKTADLPSTGHQLRYTTAAPHTGIGIPDQFRIEIIGSPTKPIRGKFSTFRCNCTETLIPNKPPVADAGADQTANIGSAVRHDGSNSYDPEGLPLTYKWALIDAPDGSRFKTSGTGGYTVDDGDLDLFTTIFSGGTDAFSVENSPLLQPGDHLIINDVVYEVSTHRWVLDPATGRYTRDDPGTWNDDEIVITKDLLVVGETDLAWKVLHSDTYFNDRTFPAPSAIPDLSGLYGVQLVVNDSELDSLPATALLNVAQTSVVLGCIPDVSWIWNLLSDFWNLLEDREIVETFWSGFAQAAAAQMLTAWQIDYNKSLLDIQRVFQRRWLDYSTRVDDDPDTAQVRIVRGPLVSQDIATGANVSGKTLQVVLDAAGVQTVTFYGTDPIPASEVADQINEQLGFGTAATKLASEHIHNAKRYVSLEYATLLRIRPQGTANAELGFSTTEYEQNDLHGHNGSPLSPTRLTAFEAAPDIGHLLDFQVEGIGSSDLLVVEGLGYRVQKPALEALAYLQPEPEWRGLTLLDPLPEVETPSQYPLPWLVPSVVVSQELDFSQELVVAGDIARFEVKNLVTGELTEVLCEVEGVNGARLGFNPAPLLEFWAGLPSNYRTQFLGIKRASYIPVDSLVVEIPRLQEIINKPSTKLEQNTDFYIEKVGDLNAIHFKDGTFSYMDPPPDVFWAEVTYLDNRPTIEANFGHLVNFKVEDLATRTDDLDYLSAVRGLWWAYFGGPALQKVKTGVQILLGLPFSEAAGTITSIEKNFSATEGRISIQDSGNVNNIRTYFYPLNAGLAINEATGVEYAEGDAIEMFAPLSGGVEVYDFVENPEWMHKYVAQYKFREIDKFFWFLVRADVDTFNMVNLIFAQDFIRKIKPHYTYPLVVMLKKLKPVEIDVIDKLTMRVDLFLADTFCSQFETGAYRWDDSDESGNWNHTYDEATPPPQFVHDTHRICPVETIWVHISYIHPGGAGWFFDTIWAYDDGGGRDRLTLHGPDHLPPPPYGPAVGVITHDATVTAGVYHRERLL